MGGVGGCVWVVWISISMPLYKSHFQEHWALSSTKLILHDRPCSGPPPSERSIIHLFSLSRAYLTREREKRRGKKKNFRRRLWTAKESIWSDDKKKKNCRTKEIKVKFNNLSWLAIYIKRLMEKCVIINAVLLQMRYCSLFQSRISIVSAA